MTLKLDVTSRLDRVQARKMLSEILNKKGFNVVFLSNHCKEEMIEDGLKMVDIFNVLKAGYILNDPELINGTYRYRVETKKIVVVISFLAPNRVRCVTTWRRQ